MDDLIYRYLNDSLDEEGQRELLAWLNEDKSNRKHFLQLYRIWISTQYDKKIDVEAELDRLRSNLRVRRQRILFHRIYIATGAVASLVLAIFIVSRYVAGDDDIVKFAKNNPLTNTDNTETTLILSDEKVILLALDEASINYNHDSVKTDMREAIPLKESARYNQLIVPYGKRSSVTFSDGTKLWANAGTRLVYPAGFDTKKREIFVDGEVYLEVTPDSSKPFIVKTNNIEVKVLGTKFGITDYDTEETKRVVLVSGSVEVSNISNERSFFLHPNQMYVSDGSQESLDVVDVDLYVCWINGKYIFDREPLGNVLSRLSRFYNVGIECDERAAKYVCSGTLDFQMEIETILTGLVYSIPIRYSKECGKYSVFIKE